MMALSEVVYAPVNETRRSPGSSARRPCRLTGGRTAAVNPAARCPSGHGLPCGRSSASDSARFPKRGFAISAWVQAGRE
jgi:hypothetical protein